MKVNYRLAEERDLEGAHHIMVEALDQFALQMGRPLVEIDFEDYLPLWHHFLATSDEGFWVAEEKNQVVGFGYGHFKETPAEILIRWGASKVAEITLVVVDPQYQNRGIGTALLQKLLEEFKKASADLVTLHCPADAKAAKHLYDKLGFEVRAYHMKKTL